MHINNHFIKLQCSVTERFYWTFSFSPQLSYPSFKSYPHLNRMSMPFRSLFSPMIWKGCMCPFHILVLLRGFLWQRDFIVMVIAVKAKSFGGSKHILILTYRWEYGNSKGFNINRSSKWVHSFISSLSERRKTWPEFHDPSTSDLLQ